MCPVCSGPPVWRNQLHTSPGQFSIQSVRLEGVVADETLWERADKPLCEGRMHQRHVMRRGALNVNSDGKALPIRDGHDFRPLAALGLAHAGPSLLGWREAPVDERFVQVQIAFVVESLGEYFQDAPQHARANPLLKPSVARLMGRIAGWQARPRSPCPQDPQDAIEHGTGLLPRPPSTVCAAHRFGQEAINEVPVLVREVARMSRSSEGHPFRGMASVPIELLPSVANGVFEDHSG